MNAESKANMEFEGKELTVWFNEYLERPAPKRSKCFNCRSKAVYIDILVTDRVECDSIVLPPSLPFLARALKKLGGILLHRVPYCDNCHEACSKRCDELKTINGIIANRMFVVSHHAEPPELADPED